MSENKKEFSFIKKKKKTLSEILNTKNWGIDFDKNEYKEIILSNSNHPESLNNPLS